MDTFSLIAIDPSLTGTGIATYYDRGEIGIELIKSERRERNCYICGKLIKNPYSKSHIKSKFHQQALKDKKEMNIDITPPIESPSIEYTKRIVGIRDQIVTMCQERKYDYAIIEGLAYSSSGSVVFDLGGLSHMIREIFLKRNIKLIVIPPTVAKKYWTGKGNASKDDMVNETKKRGWKIPFNYDDNCNDAFVFLQFLKDFVEETLDKEWIDKVEYSWKMNL